MLGDISFLGGATVVQMGHIIELVDSFGGHPRDYHEVVLDKLKKAVGHLEGAAAKEALTKELKALETKYDRAGFLGGYRSPVHSTDRIEEVNYSEPWLRNKPPPKRKKK